MLEPVEVPIYVAALGPRNLELTGELADGWIGNAFLPDHADVFLEPLREGAARAGRSLDELDLLMPVAVEFTDDVEEAARRHARGYAFTIGAMGSRDKNFYNDAFARQGFADDIAAVQALWFDGKREQAADRVPLELGLEDEPPRDAGDGQGPAASVPRRRDHHDPGQARRERPPGHAGPAPRAQLPRSSAEFAIHEDVRQSTARIAASPFIPRKDSLRGFVYDVTTGALREVEED